MSQISRQNFSKEQVILDLGTTFLGVINKQGKLTACTGAALELTRQNKEMFFMSCRLIRNLYSDFEQELGFVEFSLTVTKKHKIILIPRAQDTLVAVLPKEREHHTFVETIKEIADTSNIRNCDKIFPRVRQLNSNSILC